LLTDLPIVSVTLATMSDETTAQSAAVPASLDASMARSGGVVNEGTEAGIALGTDNAVNETPATTEIKGIYYVY
jgi:hypothetical protein